MLALTAYAPTVMQGEGEDTLSGPIDLLELTPVPGMLLKLDPDQLNVFDQLFLVNFKEENDKVMYINCIIIV